MRTTEIRSNTDVLSRNRRGFQNREMVCHEILMFLSINQVIPAVFEKRWRNNDVSSNTRTEIGSRV